jgi:hypothetical protein
LFFGGNVAIVLWKCSWRWKIELLSWLLSIYLFFTVFFSPVRYISPCKIDWHRLYKFLWKLLSNVNKKATKLLSWHLKLKLLLHITDFFVWQITIFKFPAHIFKYN